ncbi:hypothetical protein M3Y97_01067000 [Aphelenchoides bicaudatus]|nr:hypothetical protein M3Y97_01067000 [Aphelenchoides bicaudatus]
MSIRSTTSQSTDKDHIAKAFMRSFIELVENFIKEDSHLEVVYKVIMTLFDSMNCDDRSIVLKKILMHFMRKFPIDFDDNAQKSDEYIQKTLELWRIFGKCSKTMGPVAILEKVEDSYAGCWQYYKMYAESLIEEGKTDTDQLHKTFINCMEHCDLTNEQVREIFGKKIMAYVKFPEQADEDECTIQFMQVRQNDIRKSLAARRRSSLAPQRLHAILEGNDENSKPAPSIDDFSVFKDPTVVLNKRPVSYLPQSQSPTRTENLYCDKSTTRIQDTIPINDDTTIRKPPSDDFTVFKDPTVAIGQRRSFDANANSPTVCGMHMPSKKLTHANDPLLTSTPDNLRKPAPLKLNLNP